MFPGDPNATLERIRKELETIGSNIGCLAFLAAVAIVIWLLKS